MISILGVINHSKIYEISNINVRIIVLNKVNSTFHVLRLNFGFQLYLYNYALLYFVVSVSLCDFKCGALDKFSTDLIKVSKFGIDEGVQVQFTTMHKKIRLFLLYFFILNTFISNSLVLYMGNSMVLTFACNLEKTCTSEFSKIIKIARVRRTSVI